MESLTYKKCAEPGCKVVPNYGSGENNKKPTHCVTHKLEGMGPMWKTCEAEGCTSGRKYGFPGQPARTCGKPGHRLEGMINLRQRVCTVKDCNTQACSPLSPARIGHAHKGCSAFGRQHPRGP